MATPQPETDLSFPGRTTPESPVALGPPASGEKTAAGGFDLKKPNPLLEKPAPRTSFAATAASSPPNAPPRPVAPRSISAPQINAGNEFGKENADQKYGAEDKVEKPVSPRQIAAWSLSLSKPRGKMKRTIGAGALVLLALAGGYFAWTQMYPGKIDDDGAAQDGQKLAQTDDDLLGPATESFDSDDPFDDMLAAPRRSGAGTEPRRVGNSTNAAPIGRRNAALD